MKKSILMRGLLIVLAVLMLLGTVACGETKNNTETTTASSTPVNTEEQNVDPKVPAQDWDGENFTILYNGYTLEPNLDFIAEEENGGTLNDAVYKRNLAIQEKHHLVINPVYARDSNFQSELTKEQKSGDATISLVETCLNYTMQLAIDGFYAEKNTLTAIDFEKPYWYKNLLDGSSIGGKNYFFYSDSCIHAFGATPCTIFNKTIQANLNLPNLYTMVRDGDWTYEEMSKMVKGAYAQSGENTSGKMDITKDTIGLVANTFCIECFLSGSGYQMVGKDENDLPTVDNMFNESFYNIIDAIASLCAEENNMYLCDRYGSGEQIRDIDPKEAMEQNRALFWIGNFKCVERLRAMPTDFGVLPMPKATKDQAEYRTHMQVDVGAAMAVPQYVEDPEAVSAILEDIAYQSYLKVMPAYIDVLLQGQVVRDNDSQFCVQTILNSYYSDLGYMLNRKGIDIVTTLHSIFTENKSVVTELKKKENLYHSKIETICTQIDNLE